MCILDRYLVLKFIGSFFIFFVTLTGLYVVIDAFGHLDEFMQYGQQRGSLLMVLCEFYGTRIVAEFDRTSAAIALIATMFTFTTLERNNELTAISAAGISTRRIVAPLIAAVAVVAVLSVVNREVVIPGLYDYLSRTTSDLSGENGRPMQPRYDHHTDILISGSLSYRAEKRIEDASFRLPVPLGDIGRQLSAANAYYQRPDGERPGGYRLRKVTQPENIDGCPSVHIDGRPLVLTAADTPWLAKGECFVVSDVNFEQLVGGNAWRQYSSTMDLVQGLHNPSLDFGGDVRVNIHSRVTRPLLDMTLLFLGLPLLVRQNRNIFLTIGMCVGIVAAFFVVVLGCHSLGSSLFISPALAAWCPLMVFVPVAVFLSEPLWR